VQTAILRKAAKAAVLPVGALDRRRSGDFVMLLYHRLGAERSEISLRVEAFERQVAWLAGQGTVTTLERAIAGDGGVVVSFDDGTLDFYRSALPILLRHRLPAVLYLATVGVGQAGDGLTWPMIVEAHATGLITVGSHTHDHTDLSTVSEQEADGQMRRSKELIEDALGVACRHFAYPWAIGSPSADRAARRLFASAALDAWRTNRAGRTDPHRLGRVPIVRSDGWAFFRAKALGRLNAERVLYRMARRGPWRPPQPNDRRTSS